MTTTIEGQPAMRGQGLVEYGLIIFLVAIVIIGILVILGPQIGSIFSEVTASI